MKSMLGAAIGGCVHVAGLINFLELAKLEGYQIHNLGPAVPIDNLISSIEQRKPDIVAISYRLSPDAAEGILNEFKTKLELKGLRKDRVFIFGGTPKTVHVAKKIGIFLQLFDGTENVEEIRAYLQGKTFIKSDSHLPDTLITRIEAKAPIPLIRHHFGQPNLDATISGAEKLAESGVLDILSLAPDQNAQEFFFDQMSMDKSNDGAGGAPFRSEGDFIRVYEKTRRGNFPLLRCYSGTKDLIKWADILHRTIKTAWGAVPIFWYSELDSRSKRPLLEAIRENQAAIRWYADHDIPVETTDSHQWALRQSGDTIEVVTAYIGAVIAKAMGVKNHIQQYMLNTPSGMSPTMDLAKMFAKIELVESLQDEKFRCYRMIRPGLQLFDTEPNKAKGQLASSLFIGMCLDPHIVHVVSHSEGDHAALPEEIIESCRIADGSIKYAMLSKLPIKRDPEVKARIEELLNDARVLLRTITEMHEGSGQALTDPETLVKAVQTGLLDAPQLKGTVARGIITTNLIFGACRVVNPVSKLPITERERLKMIGLKTSDIKREMVDL